MSASSDDPSDTTPLVDPNPQLQTYYLSLESRIGYRLLLGGTRHFGYWSHDTYWPFPLTKALRAMEDKLAEILALPRGAQVLDAGCGVGHVAIRIAQKHGLRVSAIDIVDHHIEKARRNVKRSGLPKGAITVQKMDYHHLESFADQSLDGIYTMETFVHATDPESVLAGFHRILRPGGRVALFEYDHELVENSPEDMALSMRKINKYAAMPTNDRSNPGVFQTMLEDAGFEDIVVRDFSENIKPMTRLFFYLAIIPYFIVRLLGLERYFINTIAGVESYRGHGRWRYVAITATKPGGPLEVAKTR
ncbi:S-adenosyl-L-methionine-dependent methyltransferase [Podospora aff. communis PSN243]|uniref:S-adenosyl-L-methionine-dependent methyltransferase n=1 Tax=Podospora aff. communis PSN243 TaxID=3040156 RepID=A0AAV9GR01_9PEZI|nr:S-adenosyl-L-methionine-dependent methyltransferase [Podospora aff. communis PSN243]